MDDRKDGLESRFEPESTNPIEASLESGLPNSLTQTDPAPFWKKYIVDVSAGWMFYTPLMAGIEKYVAGMESEEVLKSRLFAAGVHAIVMRPLGKIREFVAKNIWKADANSHWLKKAASDTTAVLVTQTPAYLAILAAVGTSPDEMYKALPFGLALGASTGRIFGKVQDKWRRYCGTKPVFEK